MKKINDRKESFLEDLLTTILEIIEDKPLYTIPIGVYCILITIQHHHNGGYFLSTFEAKPMTDQKMAYVAHLNEVAPGTFLCYFKANDVLTLIVFISLNLIMYFYYSYLFIITYLKRYNQQIIEQNKKLITSINRFLNSFFTLFWWIFYTPYIEINSGSLVTGSNSFFTTSREGMGDTSYANKPKILMIFAVIGLMMTITTCLIVVFFFRNYEFHENNLLKRRYNIVLIGLVFTRFMLTFFYYLNFPIVAKLKHYIAQAIGLFGLYDHIMYLPFKNKTISQFYGASTWFFYMTVITSNLWMLTDIFPPEEHFYYFTILGSIGSGLIIQMQNYQTDTLMKIGTENFKTYFRKYDYYLEELMRLALNSTKDESEKYAILQFLAYHRSNCDDAECMCFETTFVDFKNDINIEEVSTFIIKRFNWAINSQIIQTQNEEFEHLSLKYISFLAKFKNNSPRAYNELKSLSSKRKNISIYFRTLANILSRSIEFIMKQTYVKVQQEMSQQMKMNEELEITQLLIVDDFKTEMLNPIKEYCQQKINFWTKLRSGFHNFDQLKIFSSQISQNGIQITEKYKNSIQKMNSYQVKSNCLFYKVKTLYSIFVSNEINIAFKDQAILKELQKRDDQNRFDLLSNTNLIQGNIDYIRVSISKEKGKMLQKPTEKLSRFFDYSIQDFLAITQIKSLMPSFIANIHNQLIDNMLQRGYSSCVSSVINSFGQSKFGYIFPMNIYLNHQYGVSEDFVMHGTILKINTPTQYLLFDNQGQILGITFDLFMRIFDEENNNEDHEYLINKMDSTEKTILQQKIKQFIERINVLFIIPQIAKLIQTFSNQVDKKLQKSSMKSHLLVTNHSIRLKVPRKLTELVQILKRQQNNFSKSLKSCRSNISIPQNPTEYQSKVDLLSNTGVEYLTDFISENRDYYIGDQVLNDYDLKIQLSYNEIVFGDKFQETKSYFQLNINEINRIKEKSQTLHMTTLYPQTQYQNSQYNSGSIPDWINNNKVNFIQENEDLDKKLEDSNHGFPVSIFAKNNNQMQNCQLLQSDNFQLQKKTENEDNLNTEPQNDEQLDKTNNADNSKFFMVDNIPRIDEGFQYYAKGSYTDRQNDILNQYSVSGMNHHNMLIAESERPFQQKPNNDPYLNPKQQNICHSDIDGIASPTQQSVIEDNNFNNAEKAGEEECDVSGRYPEEFANRERDDSLYQGVKIQFTDSQHGGGSQHGAVNIRNNILDEIQNVESQNETTKGEQNGTRNRQQSYQSNPYLSFTAHEVKKSIWEKRSKKENENNDNEQQNQKNVYEQIFGAADQNEMKEMIQEREINIQNSYKSLSESDEIERIYIQRQNTQSKNSTKSRVKTKDDNKNSIASSQQSIKFDNEVIKDMINTKKMPRAFSKFLIISFLYPPVLIIMSSIFVIYVVKNYNQSILDMESISNIQYLSTNYARSAMNQLGIQLMESDQFTPQNIASIYQPFYEKDAIESFKEYQNQLIEFSEKINQKHNQEIIGSSSKYDVKVFSNSESSSIKLSYPQFIDFSFNFISDFITSQQDSRDRMNSFQFLVDNFKLNNDLHKSLLVSQYKLLNEQLEMTESLFITIYIVQLLSTLSFLILQIPQIINLYKYQEKVFLIVTRIYDFETLKEITKLNTMLDILSRPSQQWMQVDFTKIITKDFNQDTKKNGKQIVLSSQIFDQKIKPWRSLIYILFIFLSAQAYFAASIIVISKQQNIIKSSFSVNKLCQETNLSMSSYVFSTEILVFEQVIRDKYPYFDQIDRQGFLQLQADQKIGITEFTTNLQTTLKKFEIFDDSTLSKVNVLIKADICTVLDCPENLKDKFSNGIVGLIQQYITLVQSYNQLTQSTSAPTDKKILLQYLEQPEHQNFMLQAFYIPLQSMNKLIQYFTDGNIDAINKVILFIQVYIITVGIFIVIFSIYMTMHLKSQFEKQTIEINFLLTLIPHEKMTEEATIHMLKSLSNCY